MGKEKDIPERIDEIAKDDSIWKEKAKKRNEERTPTKDARGASELTRMVRRRIQLDLDEQQINKIAEKVANNINEDLRHALKITQRSYTGNYKHGYIVRLTGEEMKAIQKAIESAA